MAAGVGEVRQRVGTLLSEGVANRYRLRGAGELTRLLFDGLLGDADERLTIGAVQEITPARLAALVQAFAHLAVVRLVEQDDRAGRVVVPDLVVLLLEMPFVLASSIVQRQDGGCEEVVARAD